MIYIASNIKYDTDGEKVDLPNELEINVPDEITNETEVFEYVEDEISNVTGFCHNGFALDKKD